MQAFVRKGEWSFGEGRSVTRKNADAISAERGEGGEVDKGNVNATLANRTVRGKNSRAVQQQENG